MPLKFLTVQQALDYMETLDSDEFSADECSITCLPPDPGHITDEENFIENNLDEIVPMDVSGEVELSLKRRETTKASRRKTPPKKRKRCPKEKYFSSDEDDLDKNQDQQSEPIKSTKRKKLVKLSDPISASKQNEPKKKSYVWKKAENLAPIQSEKNITFRRDAP